MKILTKKSAIVLACSAMLTLAACGGGNGVISYQPFPALPSTGTGGAGIGSGGKAFFYKDLVGDGVAEADCSPAVPADGQVVNVSVVAEDKQAEPDAAGGAIFPNASSNIEYTFNAGNYTATTSNPEYFVSPAGTYDAEGNVLSTEAPYLQDLEVDSAVTFSPSDWPQRLARLLNGKEAGETAEIPVKLEARGLLSSLLIQVATDGSDSPRDEVIGNIYTAKAERINDATVAGVTNACRFNFTLYRHFQADPAIILSKGEHGTEDDPIVITDPAIEDATLADIVFEGPALSTITSNRTLMLFLEPFMPAFEGTFSTSSSVPFVPVSLKWTHVYGISSWSLPTYRNTNGEINTVIIPPASEPAFQEFTYQKP